MRSFTVCDRRTHLAVCAWDIKWKLPISYHPGSYIQATSPNRTHSNLSLYLKDRGKRGRWWISANSEWVKSIRVFRAVLSMFDWGKDTLSVLRVFWNMCIGNVYFEKFHPHMLRAVLSKGLSGLRNGLIKDYCYLFARKFELFV